MKHAIASLALWLLTATPALPAQPPQFSGTATHSAVTTERGSLADARRLFVDRYGNFYAKSPSWDGRYLTEIDWDTGDLAIQDVATGEIRRVTNKGPWAASGEYAEASAFSPDGKRIVYGWFNQAAHGYDLRVINVDGSGMRVLRPASEAITYFEPRSWSADGKWIPMTIYRRDRANQVALMSAENGSIRVLKTVDWRHPLRVTMSPDGRFVAYDFPPDESSQQRDVYIIDTDGGREARIIATAENERFLGWLPDGSGILFSRGRSILRLPVRDGRSAGSPVLVRDDVWNLVPQGMTQRGYMYGVQVSQRQVHTARVDLAAGRILGTPEAVASDATNSSDFGVWSPVGDRLAYVQSAGFATILAIRERDSRESREISLPLVQPEGLQWAPDGQSLYVFANSLRSGNGIYRVHPRTGEVDLVVRDEGIGELRRFELAPDGKGFYTRENRDSGGGSARAIWITRREFEGGAPKRIQATFGQGGRIGFSSDGKWMAYGDYHWGGGDLRVMVAPAAGGAERMIYTFPKDRQPIGNRGTLVWTPDSRYVLFAEMNRTDSTHYLRAAPVQAGEVLTLMSSRWLDGPIWNLRFSPDGRRVAYTGGTAKAEVWLLDARELSGAAR